jgi:hypothetical protein
MGPRLVEESEAAQTLVANGGEGFGLPNASGELVLVGWY